MDESDTYSNHDAAIVVHYYLQAVAEFRGQ